MEGSSIGNKWSKSQVKPVLLVKPGIGGFVPLKGGQHKQQMEKKDVLPVMLVESLHQRVRPATPNRLQRRLNRWYTKNYSYYLICY